MNLGEDRTLRNLFIRWERIKLLFSDPTNIAMEMTEFCVSRGKWRRLEYFFHELKNVFPTVFENLYKNEKFVLNIIAYHHYKKNYQEIYRLIEQSTFTDPNAMLKLWDELHYEEKYNGKKISAVTRFRIRKRNPPPQSICPSGLRPTYSLPNYATDILKAWLANHENFPYPNKWEKNSISCETGLSIQQVQTWFANARRRNKLGKQSKSEKTERTLPNLPVISHRRKNIQNKECVAIEGMLALGQKMDCTPSYTVPPSQTATLSGNLLIPFNISCSQQHINQQEKYSKLINYNNASYHTLRPMIVNSTTAQPENIDFPCYEVRKEATDYNHYIYSQVNGVMEKCLVPKEYTILKLPVKMTSQNPTIIEPKPIQPNAIYLSLNNN